MYLARLPAKNGAHRYMIRQSYADGDHYLSRDLFDLGDDPTRYIIYPGGNGFYIDGAVETTIAARGLAVSQDELEPIFIPFLTPQIRRVIDGFDRKSRRRVLADTCRPADAFHPFDRYRLQVLKLGRGAARDPGCMPDRFYARLEYKSRDEIEYDFMAAEQVLVAEELAHYAYQIFDLQRFFSESVAHSHPEGLDQTRMDCFFIEALCRLNRDESFWGVCDATDGLRLHLVRYAVMYFDNGFPSRDPFRDYLQDFMNRHRVHRPPESVRISLAESARLFEVTVDALKKMTCRALTRQYRKLALTHHPDKGGDPEIFVKLNAAYDKLLKRKARG